MFDNIHDLARELRIIEDVLNQQRFAAGDQNPYGIRDLLCAAASLAERLAKQEQRA
jgi:hypothetical protein